MKPFILAAALMCSSLFAAVPTVVVSGHEDGSCTPKALKIYMSEPTIIRLVATPSEKFTLTSRTLNLNVSAEAGAAAEQKIKINSMGTFKFECGSRGANPSQGTITIIM